MKLTKGKLSKIRNKKNQSAKRIKKSGKGRNTKTFRKRKALNLHNTSLKKYKGGQGAKLEEKEPPVVVDTKPGELVTKAPTTDVVEEMHPTTNVVEEIPPTTDVVGEPPVDQAMETPTTDVVGEPQVEPAMETPTTDVEDPGEGPGSHQELPAPVSEVGADSAEVSSAAKEEMVEEGPTSDGSDAGSVIGSEDAASITEEPVSQQPIGNDISIVAESLDKLAEYISDKIAKKLNLGSVNSSTELNKDSFNAVANANQSLVEA
jgi:hypothetical protein